MAKRNQLACIGLPTHMTAGMVHCVSGWTRGVQVKLWDPLFPWKRVPYLSALCVHDEALYKSTITLLLPLPLPAVFPSANNKRRRQCFPVCRPSGRPLSFNTYIWRSYTCESVCAPVRPSSNTATNSEILWTRDFVDRWRDLNQKLFKFQNLYYTLQTNWKSFKVRGQRSRSWPDQLTHKGRNKHVDGVVSRLTCLMLK